MRTHKTIALKERERETLFKKKKKKILTLTQDFLNESSWSEALRSDIFKALYDSDHHRIPDRLKRKWQAKTAMGAEGNQWKGGKIQAKIEWGK